MHHLNDNEDEANFENVGDGLGLLRDDYVNKVGVEFEKGEKIPSFLAMSSGKRSGSQLGMKSRSGVNLGGFKGPSIPMGLSGIFQFDSMK
jgi:hypothetical protein